MIVAIMEHDWVELEQDSIDILKMDENNFDLFYSSSRYVAASLEYELNYLMIPSIGVFYNNRIGSVKIVFNAKEDLNLYRLLGISRKYDGVPDIICTGY